MKYSLKSLLIYFAVCSFSLAMTQVEFLTGCYALVGEIIVLAIFLPKQNWRVVAWGAVAGMVLGFILLLGYALLVRGKLSVSNYQESGEMNAIANAWRPYIIQLGGLLGATAGVLLLQKKRRELEENV